MYNHNFIEKIILTIYTIDLYLPLVKPRKTSINTTDHSFSTGMSVTVTVIYDKVVDCQTSFSLSDITTKDNGARL